MSLVVIKTMHLDKSWKQTPAAIGMAIGNGVKESRVV